MKVLHRSLAGLLLAIFVVTVTVAADDPPREPERTVPRSEAVDALRKFQQDPLANLEAASIFVKYVKEDGDVHVSMSEQLVPWMRDRDCPPRAKALLLSAFIAGNFDSQLRDKSQLDDSAAGLAYAVEIYELLKQENADLNVPELEQLLVAKRDDRLQSAVREMVDRAQPEYEED